jgi:hypothetical protein
MWKGKKLQSECGRTWSKEQGAKKKHIQPSVGNDFLTLGVVLHGIHCPRR